MGKNMGYEVTHYGHIWGSVIGKYMAVHTLIPWITAAINTVAKSTVTGASNANSMAQTCAKCNTSMKFMRRDGCYSLLKIYHSFRRNLLSHRQERINNLQLQIQVMVAEIRLLAAKITQVGWLVKQAYQRTFYSGRDRLMSI